MTTEQYKPIYDWFTARPAACRLLKVTDKVLPILVAGTYLQLLCQLLADCVYEMVSGIIYCCPVDVVPSISVADRRFYEALYVPAAVLLIGSVLRRIIDAPRPYQQPDFVPLVAKNKTGRSLPSRHSFSAGCIAVVGWMVDPLVGLWLTAAAVLICITRVLVGVHHVRDVLSGFVLGTTLCVVGISLLRYLLI